MNFFKRQNKYAFVFTLLIALGIAASYKYSSFSFKTVISILGSAAGFTYFLYAQHLAETRLFVDLFKDFNACYNEQNNELLMIQARAVGAPLSQQDKIKLCDYFNLCAEEFLFYEQQYIPKKVWKSWCNGMAQFAEVKEIREFWEQELMGESYYGFNLAKVLKQGKR